MQSLDTINIVAEVYNKLPQLSQFDVGTKWATISKRFQFSHIRVLRTLDVSDQNLGFNELPQLKSFVERNDAVAIYPLDIGCFNFGYGFRSIKAKDFWLLTKTSLYFYSSSGTRQLLKDGYYKYGEPFFLSEGAMDSELFSILGVPISIAYLTASVTDLQAQFISLLTNKVIVSPDNDRGGKAGYLKTRSNFEKYGVNVSLLSVPARYKDPGEILHCISIDDIYVKKDIEIIKQQINTLL